MTKALKLLPKINHYSEKIVRSNPTGFNWDHGFYFSDDIEDHIKGKGTQIREAMKEIYYEGNTTPSERTRKHRRKKRCGLIVDRMLITSAIWFVVLSNGIFGIIASS